MSKLERMGDDRRSERFFLIYSLILVALVLIAFTPTFFLRSLFFAPEDLAATRFGAGLPLSILVHGVFFTAWFVLVAVQPLLIAFRRADIHRFIGLSAPVVAVGSAASAAFVLAEADVAFIEEIPDRPFDGTLWGVMAFVVCVGLALHQRRRPAAHKRLMIMASLPIMPMALTRIVNLALVYELPMLPREVFIGGTWLALFATLFVHDLLKLRRIHRGTLLGLIGYFAVAVPLVLIIVKSGAWLSLVRAVA